MSADQMLAVFGGRSGGHCIMPTHKTTIRAIIIPHGCQICRCSDINGKGKTYIRASRFSKMISFILANLEEYGVLKSIVQGTVSYLLEGYIPEEFWKMKMLIRR